MAIDLATNATAGIDNTSVFTLDDANPSILLAFGILHCVMGLLGMILSLYLLIVLCYGRKDLEQAITITLTHILCGNIIQALFFSLPVSVAAFARLWPFGHLLCMILNGIQFMGFSLRWGMIGVHSIHCFLTVFFPYKYPQASNIVLIVMVISTWVIILSLTIAEVLASYFSFTTSYPVCDIDISENSLRWIGSFLLFLGSVLPAVLYFSLWVKAKFTTTVPQLGTTENDRDRSIINLSDIFKRQWKSIFTLCLLLGASVFVTLLLYINAATGAVFSSNWDLLLHFSLTLPLSIYPATDICFLTRNKSIKAAMKKFHKDIIKKYIIVCNHGSWNVVIVH